MVDTNISIENLHEIPEFSMENYRKCIARINSKENFNKFKDSGFFTIFRENCDRDTRGEILVKLEKHFKLN